MAVVLTSPGCAFAQSVAAVDDAGVRVELAAPAQRIISLAPNATELVYAAGAGAALVGVIKGSDFPVEAAKVAIIGDVNGLALERIVQLRPDLIVTWPYTAPAQVSLLRAHGIAVFMVTPAQPGGIAEDIERLGVLAGTRDQAKRAAARVRDRLGALAQAAAGKRMLRVFYQVGDAPVFTLGGGHLISRALEICGGTNVFAALSIPAPQVSAETVLNERPEVIVAGTADAVRPAWLDAWRQWQGLPAVRDNNLYVVDANLLHRAGPRFPDGVAQLCHALDEARGRR